MAEPCILGQVEDGIAALPLRVGTSGARVMIGCGAIDWHLTAEQADELAALLIQALWQAEREGGGNG